MRSSAPSPRSRQPRPFPWGVAVCIVAAAVLLLGLAAAPFLVPARLRQRVENERRAALAALSATPAAAPLRLAPAEESALRDLRVSQDFPFRGILSHSSAAPLSDEELAAFRNWKDDHPGALALFRSVTDVATNAPAPPGRPARAADAFARAAGVELSAVGRLMLFEAAQAGDAAAVEDLDRRMRNLASRLAGDTIALSLAVGSVRPARLTQFARTLPLFSDAYLDECDRDAERRLCDLAQDLLAAYRGRLSRRDAPELLPRRGGSPDPEDIEAAMDENLSLANGFRRIADAPRLCAAFADAMAEDRPADVRAGVRAALDEAGAAMVRDWPSLPRPLARDDDAGDGAHAPQRLYMAAYASAALERLAIALERHRRIHGDWPERLDELAGAPFRCFPNGEPPLYEKGTFAETPLPGGDWGRPRHAGDSGANTAESPSASLRGYRLCIVDKERCPELAPWSTRRYASGKAAWLYVGTVDSPEAP